MRRRIDDALLQWKKEQGRTAVLITGPRGAGKTHAAQKLGRTYRSCLTVDFRSAGQAVRTLFNDCLDDLDEFFGGLAAISGVPLHRRESLIILDNVQCFPRARAAVKYLVADGRHDYVETGTTVSVKRHVRGIVIPSEERTLRLGPMDFGEFLQASGHDGLMELIRRAFETRRPLPDMLHRQIMRRLGDWLLVGGMPQAVSAFLEGGHGRDFAAARAAQRDILESCARDMAAWPGREAERVRAVYGSMPGQLGRSGSFRLNALGPNMRGRSLEDAFFWLEDAGMALVSTNNPAPGEPLFGHGLERTSVRLYLCDTGLLLARIYNEDKGVPQETLEMLLSGRTGELDGRLLENAAAQMLAASGHALRFHANASRTDRAARMRIDFLLERRGLSARRFSPVTVQKGRRQTLAPLAKFAARFGDRTDTAYHVREGNLRVQDGIVCLPLYMVPCL